MSYGSGVVSGILGTLLLVGAAGGGWWLATRPAGKEKPSAPPAPAHVSKKAVEEQFNTVTLTAEAEKCLALQTGTVSQQAVPRQQVYGGEVTVPAGHTVVVAAPLAGTLKAPAEGVPAPG